MIKLQLTFVLLGSFVPCSTCQKLQYFPLSILAKILQKKCENLDNEIKRLPMKSYIGVVFTAAPLKIGTDSVAFITAADLSQQVALKWIMLKKCTWFTAMQCTGNEGLVQNTMQAFTQVILTCYAQDIKDTNELQFVLLVIEGLKVVFVSTHKLHCTQIVN